MMLWKGLLLHRLLSPTRKGVWIEDTADNMMFESNIDSVRENISSTENNINIVRDIIINEVKHNDELVKNELDMADKDGKSKCDDGDVSKDVDVIDESVEDKSGENDDRKSSIIEIDLDHVAKQYACWNTVKDIETFDKLFAELAAIDHPLRYLATRMVYSSKATGQVMVVGEAPGEEEDKSGLPFVGVSGKLLEKTFNDVGLYRDQELYITNTVPFRPPGNRAPTVDELNVFMPYVYKQVQLLNPKIIVLAGATAYRAFFDSKLTISNVRGKLMKWQSPWGEMFCCLAVFHPAYLLRVRAAIQTLQEDVIVVKNILYSSNRIDG